MSWIKFRAIAVIAFSSLVALSVFLLGDYLLGNSFLGKDLKEDEKPYLQLEHGWYELKRNFVGQDQFGPFRYPVATDSHGFRKLETTGASAKYDIIFLGDSFTYGVNGPWHETFVGMFAKESGMRVLNAGVASYSPTPYLYQYKKALQNGMLEKGHSVVIGIDISDVQDEAGYWTWNENHDVHPKRIKTKYSDKMLSNSEPTLREKIREALPMTVMLYKFVRYQLVASEEDPKLLQLMDMPRSAFTWENWATLNRTYPQEHPSGYAPLGVERGLTKVSQRVLQISNEAKKHYGNVYILIYPWPAQLKHADKFNWTAWVNNLCLVVRCTSVIDTIPHFRKLAAENGNWLLDYYLRGDIHFNERGNRVVAEHLLNHIPSKTQAH
jgi:hypothetical protein